MKHLRLLGIVLIFFLASVVPAQDGGGPDVAKGEGFEIIVPAQPTREQGKIEVIEFFWYGCPHCYSFEPVLEEWARNLPANVQFVRQPAIFSPKWEAGARAYFVAETLGVIDKVHAALFEAMQNERKPLETEEQLAEFFAAHGIDQADFHQAYNSFFVTTRMRQAEGMPARYGVNGVPAIIINGKYRTNATLAKSHPGIISVMNALIKQESGTP